MSKHSPPLGGSSKAMLRNVRPTHPSYRFGFTSNASAASCSPDPENSSVALRSTKPAKLSNTTSVPIQKHHSRPPYRPPRRKQSQAGLLEGAAPAPAPQESLGIDSQESK